MASHGLLTIACGLVFAGALFDVLDGLAARALGGGTPLGAQLDSLADMVTFGLAPAFLSYHLVGGPMTTGLVALGVAGQAAAMAGHATVLLMPIASAWRLARFNIDARQTHGFLGLPTPANALFWCGLVLGCTGAAPKALPFPPQLSAWVLLGIMLTLCILMLSDLPLPSLKFKHKGWKGNEVMFLLAGIGALLVALLGILAVPLTIGLYILSPLWGRVFRSQGTSDR